MNTDLNYLMQKDSYHFDSEQWIWGHDMKPNN